jgi:hypothetical protein
MNNIYKSIAFFTTTFVFTFITVKLQSSFGDNFAENILSLLTTLFAINIASSTLIAGKIREIQVATKIDFLKTKRSLKNSFYEQIVLIVIALVFSMFRESVYLQSVFSLFTMKLCCDTILFFCFVFYLDVIRDIGISLFELLDFDRTRG